MFYWFVNNTPQILIDYGCYKNSLDELNLKYDNLARKITNFAVEAGKDDFGRYFVAEPLLRFAIDQNIYRKSADYIYRHYVYNKISEIEPVNIPFMEFCDLYEEFMLVPEGYGLSRRDLTLN